MAASYKKRISSAVKLLYSEKIKEYSRLKEAKSFIRNRKLPLCDLILSVLVKKGLSSVMELRPFLIQKGQPHKHISIQGYFKQRKKLNDTVFSFLNRQYLKDFYRSGEAILWNGFLVFAVDGTKAEVPPSAENKQHFGESRNQSERVSTRALASSICDGYNDFILDIQIDSIITSESKLAKENRMAIKDIVLDDRAIVLFERGYPSLHLIHFMEKNKRYYVMRLVTNAFKKELKQAGTDEWLDLKHTNPRIEKVKKYQPQIWMEMRQKGSTKTRAIKSQTPSGKALILLTNLPDSCSGEDIIALYFKRWKIELTDQTLKNKMKLEIITGKATCYVYQDLWAQIYLYHLIHDIMHAGDKEVKRMVCKRHYKHEIRMNENLAIGLFKEHFMWIWLEKSEQKRIVLLNRLKKLMEEYILPIRKLPSSERTKKPSNKYCSNLKMSY